MNAEALKVLAQDASTAQYVVHDIYQKLQNLALQGYLQATIDIPEGVAMLVINQLEDDGFVVVHNNKYTVYWG